MGRRLGVVVPRSTMLRVHQTSGGLTQLIKVKSTAPAGSKVSRKATITSVGDLSKQDAVKFIGKRS